MVDVYFDDVSVTYTPSNIIQSTDYYPFGHQTDASWTRTDVQPNQYLYNAGSELNKTTGSYEMFFRQYDPLIGRMNAIDPMAGKYGSWTPYHYSMNNPVFWNDPFGLDNVEIKTSEDFWNIVDELMNNNSYGGYGGSWSAGNGISYFTSDEEAYYAGADYNDKWKSWSYTKPGSWEAAARAYKDQTGTMPLRGATITANRLTHSFSGSVYSDRDWLNKRIDEGFAILEHSYDFWQTMSNPLVQGMRRQSDAFFADPRVQIFYGFVLGGPTVSAGSIVAKAALSTRLISAGVDAGTQITMNAIANGGDIGSAISNINVTSIALSAANPTANLRNVITNSALSSAFEIKLDLRNSNNIMTGKGLGEVAFSVGISTATFGVLSGVRATGNYYMGYATGRGNYLLSDGFTSNSSAYRTLAYTWAVAASLNFTGGYAGFGGSVSGSIFGN